MNCQEMESIIADLARGVEADERALGHLRSCPRCGERFADELKLTEGLLAWAGACSHEEAPPRVEEKLRQAFIENNRRPPALPSRRRWIPALAAGSIAAGLLLVKLFTPAHPVTPMQPKVVETASVASAPVVSPPEKIRAARPMVRRIRRPAPAPAEVEFLPVPQGDAWTPRDGGRLVRVELPRTALREFGLPMDEERAHEQVQADVMLSNDGLLRAIRFVK